MTFFIKNMVCNRCIMAVSSIFKNISLTPINIQLGEVTTQEELNKEQLQSLKNQLEAMGFELLNTQQQQIIEKIKSTVILQIQKESGVNLNFSDLLSEKLHKDYSYLSKLFSTTEGITIEQYIILQKVEKIKELLIYNELNISEIAFKLKYSSVAHLSSQFKKITGLTPSQFKSQRDYKRKPLDTV